MSFPASLRNMVVTLISFPIVFLIFGIYQGLIQVLSRAGFLKTTDFLGINYYQGLTAHGLINAILLTTFFAVAFGHVLIFQTIGRVQMTLVRTSFFLMILGSSSVLWAVFTGRASVLYTFFPPLKAHPVFYLGLALFVVGSWVGFWSWIYPSLEWKKMNPDKKWPLSTFGILITFILWQIATIPVAVEILVLLLPWSLNWTDSVNVVLSRMLFWFFGHALVYFWLLPIYVMYYNVLPKIIGGKTFSDAAGRFTFLVLLLFSTPVGIHHQFTEPGISAAWKAVHTVLTSLVALPSLVTAFTLAAAMEYAARLKGGKGLFAWWKKLPYFESKSWLFSYFFAGLVIFIFGGATGVVNASYNVNQVVHNTAWIPAHFHMTVAGPVFLGILGMSLFILTGIMGKRVIRPKLAILVPYTWMVGIFIMSSGMFIGGIQGEPRRTNMGLTYLNPASPEFRPDWVFPTAMSAIGGIVLTIAVIIYFYVLIESVMSPKVQEAKFEIPLAAPYHDEDIGIIKSIKPWVIGALVLAVFAYASPIYQIVKADIPGEPGFSPDSPIPIQREGK